MSKQRERHICITIDVCEDIYAPKPWGYLKRLEELREAFTNHLTKREHECKITWFPRADMDIKKIMGSVTAVIEKPVFTAFIQQGDELGWHAHFYDELGIQVADGEAMVNEARKVLPLVKKVVPDLKSSRFGRLHLTNQLAAVLVEHGIRQDTNCLSGRKENRENMIFDWSTSPSTPYNMSQEDYRVPGEPTLGLTEIPYAMKSMQASYDKAPVRRYINIAFHHNLIKDGLDELDELSIIVLVCHPFELLEHESHGLIAFDVDVALLNLDTIIDHFEAKGEKIRFTTIKEAADAWREQHE